MRLFLTRALKGDALNGQGSLFWADIIRRETADNTIPTDTSACETAAKNKKGGCQPPFYCSCSFFP